MGWIAADFKGTKVWAEVDDGGQPVVDAGRRPIRYSDAPGSKIYKAAAASVSDLGGPVRALDAGVPAEPRPAAGAAAPGRPGKGSGYGSAGTRSTAQAAAAAKDAKARIAALPAGTILAFTDGACTGNPGPAGSGAVVKLPDGRVFERHRACGWATNNVGELTAVLLALELLTEAGVDVAAPVALFTDSEYTLGVLTKGWKAKANAELIADIKGRLRPWRQLSVEWVAGHVGVAENERADILARRGVDESRRR
jgi:ribonuclease HI